MRDRWRPTGDRVAGGVEAALKKGAWEGASEEEDWAKASWAGAVSLAAAVLWATV